MENAVLAPPPAVAPDNPRSRGAALLSKMIVRAVTFCYDPTPPGSLFVADSGSA